MKKKWYSDTFWQNQKESIRTFYLRFLQTVEHLQNLDIFPADDHATFHSTFMDDFFGKLNDEFYLIVDNKLRDTNRSPEDVTHTSIFAWVDTAQKYNNSIHALTRNDNISVDQDMQKLTKQPVKDYCYYCGKTGHHLKNLPKQGLDLSWQTGKQTFVPSLHWLPKETWVSRWWNFSTNKHCRRSN